MPFSCAPFQGPPQQTTMNDTQIFVIDDQQVLDMVVRSLQEGLDDLRDRLTALQASLSPYYDMLSNVREAISPRTIRPLRELWQHRWEALHRSCNELLTDATVNRARFAHLPDLEPLDDVQRALFELGEEISRRHQRHEDFIRLYVATSAFSGNEADLDAHVERVNRIGWLTAQELNDTAETLALSADEKKALEAGNRAWKEIMDMTWHVAELLSVDSAKAFNEVIKKRPLKPGASASRCARQRKAQVCQLKARPSSPMPAIVHRRHRGHQSERRRGQRHEET